MSYWKKIKAMKVNSFIIVDGTINNGTILFRVADHNLFESAEPIPSLWPQT